MAFSTYGPLLLSPRFDAKPWGGRRLAKFGFVLPADQAIGEALITASEATIMNGPRSGFSLGELVAQDPSHAIGERGIRLTHGLPLFPILIKLIDASENLSIQVHPTDETAPAGSLGKTEAWHILEAEPGSVLYLGLSEGVDTAEIGRIARKGRSTAHLMRSVPAVSGMTVLLPAGTVHALGAGVVIYEIQQPSGITYRLDDWGRRDANGQGRELHIDLGIDVIDPGSRPDPIPPKSLPIEAGTRTLLVSCSLFTAERLELPSGASVKLDGSEAPQVFTVLSGKLSVTACANSVDLSAGQTAALLADSGPAVLSALAESVVLRGWLDPDA